MLRPYQFNKFKTSTDLHTYLDYLTKYLEVLEMSLNFKKRFLDNKLHLDISITDNKENVFSFLFKVVDSNSYTNFDKSIFDELIYYVESKELTLNIIREDNFLYLKLTRLNDFSDNLAHQMKNRRMEYAKRRERKRKHKQSYSELIESITLAQDLV